MTAREMKPTVVADGLPRQRALRGRIFLTIALLALIAAGLWFGFSPSQRRNTAGVPPEHQGTRHAGTFSEGRAITQSAAPAATAPAVGDERLSAAVKALAQARQQATAESEQRMAAAEQAQQTAQQQASQLAAQQHQLDEVAAQQAAQTRKIAQDNARLLSEQASMEQARLEAANVAARAAAGTRARPAYSGPSSGTLVWQGEVDGTTLVTITGAQPDQGRVLSGSLPGVLVLLQPRDGKHVVIASTPAPSNEYQRLTLRVQGKGLVEEAIHWSIP